jgi:hypothetical protein
MTAILIVAVIVLSAGLMAYAGQRLMAVIDGRLRARLARAREAATPEPPHAAPAAPFTRRHMPVRVVRPARHLESTTVDRGADR